MSGGKSLFDLIFNPSSVAVIGASREEGSPGYIIFSNMVKNVRNGILKARVFGVNIKGGRLFGYDLFKSILDVPAHIEHAVIAVPARSVPNILEECGMKGVPVATIISSGFSEVGNIELEEKLLDIASRYNMRIIGPNCLGVYDPYSGMDTIFVPEKKRVDGEEIINLARPPRGLIAFLSQSGALGGVILDYLAGEGIGISRFICLGNKIDVDEADILPLLIDDEKTRVVALYVEAIKKRAREIVEICRKTTRFKPIILLKGGITSSGQRATMSHTASMAGQPDIFISAFRNSGCLIASDVSSMLDMAKALALQPPARGRDVCIITNGGGPGIITADLAEKNGLRVPSLSEETLVELKRYVSEGAIPEIATFANPIDLSGMATDESHVVATEVAMQDERVDMVILLALHHIPYVTNRLPYEISRIVRDYKKPIVVVDIGLLGLSQFVRRVFEENSIPSYSLPERAVNGAYGLAYYGAWLRKNNMYEDYLENWSPPKLSLFLVAA